MANDKVVKPDEVIAFEELNKLKDKKYIFVRETVIGEDAYIDFYMATTPEMVFRLLDHLYNIEPKIILAFMAHRAMKELELKKAQMESQDVKKH